jgi:hypothetical protein
MTLRQVAGSTDEMGHAGLSGCDPMLIHPIAIADHSKMTSHWSKARDQATLRAFVSRLFTLCAT